MKSWFVLYKTAILLYVALCAPGLSAQDSVSTNESSVLFKTRFTQVKDDFNYGLVFRGMDITLGYAFIKSSDQAMITYQGSFAFGKNYNSGVGEYWSIKPLDSYYGYRTRISRKKSLYAGPFIALQYRWHFYPDLQSGHMFWFTTMEAGPRLIFEMPCKSGNIRITLSNSLAGWASRPVPMTETTFYSLKFREFADNGNSNLRFGSFNRFNHTEFEAGLARKKGKRSSLSYVFEYLGYYCEPAIIMINHSIQIKWIIGEI